MQLDKLAEAAGVVVVHRLGVPEGLHDGTVGRRGGSAVNAAATHDTFLAPIKDKNREGQS